MLGLQIVVVAFQAFIWRHLSVTCSATGLRVQLGTDDEVKSNQSTQQRKELNMCTRALSEPDFTNQQASPSVLFTPHYCKNIHAALNLTTLNLSFA